MSTGQGQVAELYKVRWQIEMMFKMCKSGFGMQQMLEGEGRKHLSGEEQHLPVANVHLPVDAADILSLCRESEQAVWQQIFASQRSSWQNRWLLIAATKKGKTGQIWMI